MAVFERILLAVDGSAHSTKAVAAAAEVARCSGGEMYVLHVHEEGLVASVETPREATDLVNGVVDELRRDGVKAEGETATAASGKLAPTILDAAKALDSGLIVMGTRGLSDFSALLVGSTAHKVLHHAECPVLLVR
jgi:nucleotide-binding universal stress UspA family protein